MEADSESLRLANYSINPLVSGYKDKWIFFPATGYYMDTALYSVGGVGSCWSSSLNIVSAWAVVFGSDSVFRGWCDRLWTIHPSRLPLANHPVFRQVNNKRSSEWHGFCFIQ